VKARSTPASFIERKGLGDPWGGSRVGEEKKSNERNLLLLISPFRMALGKEALLQAKEEMKR